jgi:hypothetical protein
MSTNSSGPGYEFLGVIGVDPVDGGRSVCIKPFGLKLAQPEILSFLPTSKCILRIEEFCGPRNFFLFFQVHVLFVNGRMVRNLGKEQQRPFSTGRNFPVLFILFREGMERNSGRGNFYLNDCIQFQAHSTMHADDAATVQPFLT